MADIFAIFGILLFLGLTFPGMLLTFWLLFPGRVGRAKTRLERTPWKCLALGGVVSLVAGIPVIILLVMPFGPAKLLGFCLLFLVLGFGGVGAAGLAARMGDEFQRRSAPEIARTSAFLRGAIALELAAAFPVIGWFMIVPLATVASLGATTFALLRWEPGPERAAVERGAQSPQAGEIAHDAVSP